MRVVVYAITAADDARQGSRGVLNERLRTIRMGRLSAIVGDVVRAPAPTEKNLRRFASLIARLAGTRSAILPARFGTVVWTDDEVEIVLGARQEGLLKQLAHVRGRVQMTVRVIVEGQEAKRERGGKGTRDSGSSYLKRRAAARRASSIPEFAPLARAVARWVKDERVERKGSVVTVYHLVPARHSTRYADAVENAALASGAHGFVTGPWPPYAFADTW
jgi:hypothetical protein